MTVKPLDPRKEKRYFTKMGSDHPVEMAYNEGGWAANRNCLLVWPAVTPSNPYPAGRRHDAWARGYGLYREDQLT